LRLKENFRTMHDYPEKEKLISIFRDIKPYFKERLGKYTHQRVAGEWHFHGLAFVRDEMTYVFGINIGFFRLIENSSYSHVGMNVLVRTNGVNTELRLKIKDFFRENLKDWITSPEKPYTSFRGGEGTEFPRYKLISEFETEEQILQFLYESIDVIHEKIYPKIIENHNEMFNFIVRAAPPWHESLIQYCKEAVDGKFKRSQSGGDNDTNW